MLVGIAPPSMTYIDDVYAITGDESLSMSVMDPQLFSKRLSVYFHHHVETAKSAGMSRTRVTAIASGNTHGISTDVLIRVLGAAGYRAEVRMKKAAA